MKTSPSLLERLQRPGAEDAWARFVGLYTPLLYHWARAVGCHEADAADLVQDVLELLVRKLPEFRYSQTGSFRAWLHTVTLNRWRENLRRTRAARIGTNHPLPDDCPAPDTHTLFEEKEYRRYLVHRALEALRPEFPASTWSLFQAYVLENRSATDVAAEHRVSTGTVYAAKSRILARVREEVHELLD